MAFQNNYPSTSASMRMHSIYRMSDTQPDWAQTDPSQPDYIKNKELAQKLRPVSVNGFEFLNDSYTSGGLNLVSGKNITLNVEGNSIIISASAEAGEGGDYPEYSLIEAENPSLGSQATYHLLKDGTIVGTAIEIPSQVDYTITLSSEEKNNEDNGIVTNYTLLQCGKEIGQIEVPVNNNAYTVLDTDTIGMTIDGTEIKANLKISSENGNSLTIKEDGLYANTAVGEYKAGAGLNLKDNIFSVNLAENSHGLVAVDGTLSLVLATKDEDGAMSKEDKVFINKLKALDNSSGFATQNDLKTLQETIAQIEQAHSWGKF